MDDKDRPGGDEGAESVEDRGGGSRGEGTPGTRLVHDRQDEEPPKSFKTIHVSSSAKARTRIRTCEGCGHDNIAEARYCEGCGDDLDEQEKKKEFDKSMQRLEEYTEKAAKVRPKKDGRTILRRYKTPVMQPPVDIEKKSYHSHYIPGGAGQVQQYDPSGFRSDREPVVQQGYIQPVYAQPGVIQPALPQYVALPVNYNIQAQTKKKSTSFIVGVALLAFLALVLISLVITIIVLAL